MSAKRQKDEGWISWGLIVLLFIFGLSPLALVLLFLKLFGVGSGEKKQQAAPPPLQETTGQSTEHFRQALEQAVAGTGPDLLMHSPAMNLPLAALRHLAPGHELEQMEAFQMAFYAQGRDVMAAGEQAAIAAAWLPAGTPADALTAAMADPAIRSAARHDAAEAEEVMGEFLLYPTLYLEHDGQRTLLARGYSDYASVRAKLDDALRGVRESPVAQGAACGLDGKCCF